MMMPSFNNTTLADPHVPLCAKRFDPHTVYVVYDMQFSPRMETETGYAWMTLTALILIGNLFVLLWRCTRPREQRNSVPSILVINLATADLLLGVQMLLYLLLFKWPCLLLADPNLFDVAERMCVVSAGIQSASFPLSAMMTATIAFYYTTILFSYRRCSWSKSCVIILLLSEWIAAIVMGVVQAFRYHSRDVVPPFRTEGTTETPDAEQTVEAERYNSLMCIPMGYTKDTDDMRISFRSTFYINIGILVLLFLAVIACVATLIQLRSMTKKSTDTSIVMGVGLRLIATSFLTFAFWAVYIPLQETGRNFDSLIVLSMVGVANPLIFTLSSKPFYRSVRKLWIVLRFKCGKPMPFEDVENYSITETGMLASELYESAN